MGATVLLRGPAHAARARAADSARPTPAPVCARSAGSVANLARGQEGVGRGRRPRRRVLVGDNAVAPVCLRYGALLVARIRAGGARLPGPSSSRAAGANAGLCLGGGGLDSGGGDASDCPVSATGCGPGVEARRAGWRPRLGLAVTPRLANLVAAAPTPRAAGKNRPGAAPAPGGSPERFPAGVPCGTPGLS